MPNNVMAMKITETVIGRRILVELIDTRINYIMCKIL